MEPEKFLHDFKTNYHHKLLMRGLASRAPSQEEAREYPPLLIDHNHENTSHPLTSEQVRILLHIQLIYFCEHCTENVRETEHQSAIYHTSVPLDQVPDPTAYLHAIVIISRRRK